MPGVNPRYGGGGGGGGAGGPRRRGQRPGPRARRGGAGSARRSEAESWRNIRRGNANGPGATLRTRSSCDPRRSDLADVLRLQALRTLGDLEFDRIALGETAEALSLDRREVDEHIGTRLLRDKAKALR